MEGYSGEEEENKGRRRGVGGGIIKREGRILGGE